jgi:hypothetical protein
LNVIRCSALAAAETAFDVFVTADQNLQYQQNLQSTVIGIIVLIAPNTRFDTLQPLVPRVLQALLTIQQVMLFILRANAAGVMEKEIILPAALPNSADCWSLGGTAMVQNLLLLPQ